VPRKGLKERLREKAQNNRPNYSTGERKCTEEEIPSGGEKKKERTASRFPERGPLSRAKFRQGTHAFVWRERVHIGLEGRSLRGGHKERAEDY